MKIRMIEFTVGAFMLAGLISLLVLALQVSGLEHLFQEEPGYKVYAEFSNIGGLKPRAKVSVGGVVVGRVTRIVLEPNSYYAKVTLYINPNRVERLPSDTRASIMTAGLLGDNFISLTPGFDEVRALENGSTIPIVNTDSAVSLEQLISKFMAGQASKEKPELENGPFEPKQEAPQKQKTSYIQTESQGTHL